MEKFDNIRYSIYNNVSGIYMITCGNHTYIGSSVNLYYRLKEHISYLKRNIHQNQFLQNAYNKYGYNNLYFTIIEIVKDGNKLRIREKYYIDTLKPNINFQLDPLNYSVSKITKLKISNTLKKRYKNKEIDIVNRKKIYMYDFNGNYIDKYNSITECSLKNNIPIKGISKCLNTGVKTCKGFRFTQVYKPKLSKIKSNHFRYHNYL